MQYAQARLRPNRRCSILDLSFPKPSDSPPYLRRSGNLSPQSRAMRVACPNVERRRPLLLASLPTRWRAPRDADRESSGGLSRSSATSSSNASLATARVGSRAIRRPAGCTQARFGPSGRSTAPAAVPARIAGRQRHSVPRRSANPPSNPEAELGLLEVHEKTVHPSKPTCSNTSRRASRTAPGTQSTSTTFAMSEGAVQLNVSLPSCRHRPP